MGDDWRLRIDFRNDGAADALQDRLDARQLGHDLSRAFHDRVIVSRDGTTLFLYAGDREQAEKARRLVERYGEENSEELQVQFTRWHPLALEWRPADQPLPEEDEARMREHQKRVAAERRESEEQGYPMYEVRIDLPSHEEAEAFSDRLRNEGLPTVHRWKYVLVGAADEDAARALADRIGAEAPVKSHVQVEATWPEMLDDRPLNPFAIFGGRGG